MADQSKKEGSKGTEAQEPRNREQIQNRGEGQGGLQQRQSMGSPMTPFSFMRRFSEEMDRLFEDFGLGRGLLSPFTASGGGRISPAEFGRRMWNPPIEMFTRGDQLVVRAELPGMSKEDVRVECTDEDIVIQGERRQEHKEEREGTYHSERTYGRFYRTIPLPEGVSAEGAKATFKDGILEITMKAPEKIKSRQIKIEG